MARRLSAVLAVEADLRKNVQRTLTNAHRALQKPELLDGLSGKYEPVAEDGEQLPDEWKLVQATAKEMIQTTVAELTTLYDATAVRDFTNASGKAVADVVVDGEVLVEKAPAPYLLWLDKQLDDLNAFVGKMATLDPGTTWEPHDAERGISKSRVVETARQTQQPRTHVIFEPTKDQPGQAQVYTVPVTLGVWRRYKFSGAIAASERAAILGRIRKLKHAVATALTEANRTDVVEVAPGEAILDFVFNG